MPGFAEVFEWLNFNDQTNLSEEDKLNLRELNDTSMALSQKEGAIKGLKINAEASFKPLEAAEIKINLAFYYYQTKNYEAATLYLNDCDNLYEKNSHRAGVLNWLKGILLWKKKENIKAHAAWRVAINAFESLREWQKSEKVAVKVIWYDERLEKMKIEITQTAEEAYDWLNRWENSALDERARMFVREIEDRINRNDYPSAFEIGMGLSRISRLRLNPAESAETSVVIGMKYHRMGQAKLAIDYFQRAGASFTPGNYHQAVTKWMLGAAQWDLRNERDNAFKSWREAIYLFEDVMQQTDRTNDQKKRAWLEEKIYIMGKALDSKTKELLRKP